MTKYILIAMTLCLLLVGMVAANGIGGDTYPAIIGIGEGSGTVTLPITVTDGSNVGSADITISFDPAIVTVTGVTKGDMDSMVANTEFVGDGWVRIGTFQMGTPGLDGDFNVADVTFKSVSSSGSCPLAISVETFKDATSQGNPMSHETSDGIYTATSNGGNGGNGGDNGDGNGDDGNVTPTVTPTTTPTTSPTASPTANLPGNGTDDGSSIVWVLIIIGIIIVVIIIYYMTKNDGGK